MPLLPGAEPYHHDGGPVGALLCHGFPSTPQSLRPWAEHLARQGLSVSLPRLPGHGTRWQDLVLTRWPDWYAEVDRAFRGLRDSCEQVFVMGLSMGACLALRLAEEHGAAVAGLVLVNPSLHSEKRALRALPLMKHLLPSVQGVANDIKRPGARELAYDRTPLRALSSLTDLWAATRADLPKVVQPLLLFRSPEDHVVEPSNSTLLLSRISSTDVEERLCVDSYHVVPLDNDAEQVFAGSVEFVHRLAPAPTPSPRGA